MQIKKTLFLKNYTDNSSNGILSLEKDNNTIYATLNCALINNSPNLAMGLNIDNKIHKYALTSNIQTFTINTSPTFSFDDKISCAIVDLSNISKPQLVLGASLINNETLVNIFQEEKRAELYETTDEELQEEIDKELGCKNCSECKYRECFYDGISKENVTNISSSAIQANSLDKTIKETFEENKDTDSQNFYERIQEQLNDLFKQHPTEEVLEEILPNSKWLKIELSNNNYYALGIIYQDTKPKYIGYALPQEIAGQPPEDIKEYAQWLPTDITQPTKSGYWLVYQDVDTGDSILVDIV